MNSLTQVQAFGTTPIASSLFHPFSLFLFISNYFFNHFIKSYGILT